MSENQEKRDWFVVAFPAFMTMGLLTVAVASDWYSIAAILKDNWSGVGLTVVGIIGLISLFFGVSSARKSYALIKQNPSVAIQFVAFAIIAAVLIYLRIK